jgi:thiamine biosynthesis lipoprotein
MTGSMKRILTIPLSLILALALFGCGRQPQLHEIDNFAQGTTYHITWWADHAVNETSLRKEIDTVLAKIDRQISNYRSDSDIERFNRSRSTAWQSLPPPVIQLLAIAQRVYRDSNGCYDPTVAPLFDLWGFRKATPHVPGPKAIAAVRREIGFNHVELDVPRHRLRKTIPQLAIDMSSLGEGYSISLLARVLEQHDIHNYIVEFGGDMLVKGHKPNQAKWRIAIAQPTPWKLAAQEVATIENEDGVSVNTSGTYRRFFDKRGKTYSHILDPRTGYPVTHNLVSATVFDIDPRVGDAWATAMLCLGKTAGETVAKKTDIKVFFVQRGSAAMDGTESVALRNTRSIHIN